MSYPRFQRSRDFKKALRTAGNVTIGTSVINVDTGLDMTLVAEAGDVIEYGINASVATAPGSDGSTTVATLVAGSPVNYFGGAGTLAVGVCPSGWYTPNINVSGMVLPFGGPVLYTLVSGDISAGTVTLRLRAIGGGGGACAIRSTSSSPMNVYARNLGPLDPN